MSRTSVFSSSTIISLNSRKISASSSQLSYPLASKIIVKNLSYATSETSLRKEFSNFGQVAEVKLIKDEGGKRSRGYAFIQYTSQDDAMLALENLDRKYIDGRIVYVEIARILNNPSGFYLRPSGPPTDQQCPE